MDNSSENPTEQNSWYDTYANQEMRDMIVWGYQLQDAAISSLIV